MTKLEEVARAICKSRSCEGINCCQWPAQGGRTVCPVKHGAYNDAARAAVEALRVPNDAMRQVPSQGWALVIDAILEEKP